MKYGSVCSGIESATAAWHPLGWEPQFFAEIAKFPSALLAHHYPNVPNHGDFTTIQSGDYEPIDLLVGGTPCQDFSVAGLRAGINGERGALTIEFARLAGRLRSRWVVWENVPGVLSADGGRAFGIFLGLLGQFGYQCAWRILDAQHFGVPQRRRRVFLVGHLGDWRRAAAVLFERHSLSGNPAPRREKGQSAPCIPSRSSAGGGFGSDFDCDGGLIASTGGLRVSDVRGDERGGLVSDVRMVRPRAIASTGNISHCLNGGAMGRQDFETETLIVGGFPDVTHALRVDGFDASEDGTGRGTPLVPVTASTIQAHRGDGGGGLSPDETLVPIAFDSKASGRNGFGVGDVSPTLRAMGHANSHSNAGGQVAVAMNLRGRDGGAMPEMSDVASLRAADGGSSQSYVAGGMAVRRLTPRECERLQGFPDDYTLVPFRKKPAADGPRYKALGNSKAVPVVRWIGERIAAVDAL